MTETLRKVTFKKQPQGYSVWLDGTFIGNVTKHSERYNLRRPCTVHWWRAWPLEGKDETKHRIRAAAVDALILAYEPLLPGAQTLLAKLWQAGLLQHHLMGSGERFLTLENGTRIELTDNENDLFYLCTEHGGVLVPDDERCATHRNAKLLEGFISDKPGKPCTDCGEVGRLTWLNDDGTCRRSDTHKENR